MRIVFFIGSLKTGGAERLIAMLARDIGRAGHEVVLLAMESHRDNPAIASLLEGIEHRTVLGPPRAGPARLMQLLGGWRPLRRCLREVRPDVVYAMLEWSNWLALRAVRGMADRPAVTIALVNADEQLNWKRRLPTMLTERRGRPDGIVTNSAPGLESAHARGLHAPVERVVLGGIDTSDFAFRPEGARKVRSELGLVDGDVLVGHVGRISPAKNQVGLLDAFAVVRRTLPRARLLCVGEGDVVRAGQLRDRARALGIADATTWWDRADELDAVYSAMDVMALPSHWEGCPNVVMEAMGCGTPCVVSDVGASAAIVGDTGAVADPCTPDSVGQAILKVLGSRPDRAAIRNRILEQFTLCHPVEGTIAFLQDVLEARGTAT